MTPDRAPGVSWGLRPLGEYPNGMVLTVPGDAIDISFYEFRGDPGQGIRLSRRDARLLAKRINQCLDATAKK